MGVAKILISVIRSVGRFFTIAGLILQIIGAWGCHMLVKHPYDVLASFRRHEDYDTSTDGRACVMFNTSGISLAGLDDTTYNFAKWMSYLATIFGLIAVFSDCTILKTCPSHAARSRSVQIMVVGSLQIMVCLMLGLSFTIFNSAFCTKGWTDTSGEVLTEDVDGPYSCTLAWGGICMAVAVALWGAAGVMTLGKARTERAEERKREQDRADADASKRIAQGGGGDDDDGSGKKEEAAAAAASREEVEGI